MWSFVKLVSGVTSIGGKLWVFLQRKTDVEIVFYLQAFRSYEKVHVAPSVSDIKHQHQLGKLLRETCILVET